jgi:thymidylate synthase
MTSVTAETAAEVFAGAVGLAVRGERVSPRGLATREVLGVTLCLREPRARLVVAPGRVINPAFAAAETVWVLAGSDAPWIFEYNGRLRRYADGGVLRGAYGPRLRSWTGGIDQLGRVVELLRADPDTRRAVVQLYDPARDAAGHRDVPCTLGYCFYLRRGRLHMVTSMRSQDAWTGLPYDLFCATVVHELVADWVGAELGEYRHQVGSLHVYEADLEAAAALGETPAGLVMAGLGTPWSGFERLLGRLAGGARTGHRGWDALGAAMRSYRLWRGGEQAQAREVAGGIAGPMGDAMAAWYAELDRRADERARRADPADRGATT